MRTAAEIEAELERDRARDRLHDARVKVCAWAGLIVERREAGESWDYSYKQLRVALENEKAAEAALDAAIEGSRGTVGPPV